MLLPVPAATAILAGDFAKTGAKDVCLSSRSLNDG